ncbi:MAG TPA: hypothetical protein VEB22_08400, partial [Phycisphaerales bacterium]|nr:hypothetical protein [Phycisphaerales bacterium]
MQSPKTRCWRCGYDLAGLPLASTETGWVCPECGGWTAVEVEPRPPASALEGLRWAGVAGLIALLLLSVPVAAMALVGNAVVAAVATAASMFVAAGGVEAAMARSAGRRVEWLRVVLLGG